MYTGEIMLKKSMKSDEIWKIRKFSISLKYKEPYLQKYLRY